ncbi:uncharacterized protein [Spinacia oleracea]|uniref:Uncharacterized protein n=1 Tax=Spinacia oleracea TaxID=3562 RepID=A0A9R0J0P3_SPIOL|nr:uncharacterized protein LOC110796957 [Spinacia oleracea]
MSSPCPNFTDLSDLHKCANDLLHSPHIQQALHHHHHHQQQQQQQHEAMSSVREISDASLKMLDLCGTTREFHLLIKQHLQDLQHTLRRAKIEEFDFDAHILVHNVYRKKLKKKVSKCLRNTKGFKSKYFTSDLSLLDHSLIVVVHVLREVRGATISTLESLLSLVILPTNIPRINSGQSSSFSSKLRRINCRRLLERCDSMDVVVASKRLEEVASAMEELEVELESIIRRLLRTRVLLLNILTN